MRCGVSSTLRAVSLWKLPKLGCRQPEALITFRRQGKTTIQKCYHLGLTVRRTGQYTGLYCFAFAKKARIFVFIGGGGGGEERSFLMVFSIHFLKTEFVKYLAV